MDHFDYLKKIFYISSLFVFLYVLLTSFLFPDAFRQYFVDMEIFGIYPYFLFFSLILFAFGVLLAYRAYKFEYSSLRILITSVFAGSLSYFFGFLNWDPTRTSNYTQTRFYQLQVLFTTLATFLLYLHYELNDRDQPKTINIGILTFLLTPYSIFNLYYLIFDFYPDGMDVLELITLIMLQIGSVIVFLVIALNGYRLTKVMISHNKETKTLGGIQFAGLIVLLYNVLLEMLDNIPGVNMFNTALFIFAFLLIGIPFYMDPRVFAAVPINIHLMAIIDKSGRSLYYLPVSDDFAGENEEITSQLFAGLTVAFSSLGREVAKTNEQVDSLNFGDRSMIIEYMDPYYLILVAARSTYFLQREMREYLIELKQHHPVPPLSDFSHELMAKLNEKFYPLISRID
ncbi:MAG: hypothetical protein INQ03_23150 [Candidatus Heimdallarchaeota archaeon]|nr:hypothetical protein [Candidatus Heimdallarchaeota archaeon]